MRTLPWIRPVYFLLSRFVHLQCPSSFETPGNTPRNVGKTLRLFLWLDDLCFASIQFTRLTGRLKQMIWSDRLANRPLNAVLPCNTGGKKDVFTTWWDVKNSHRFPPESPRGLTFTWWRCCRLCLWHKLTELAHSFLLCSRVFFCLCGLFYGISLHKLSRQLSVFSFCPSGLISVLMAALT